MCYGMSANEVARGSNWEKINKGTNLSAKDIYLFSINNHKWNYFSTKISAKKQCLNF